MSIAKHTFHEEVKRMNNRITNQTSKQMSKGIFSVLITEVRYRNWIMLFFLDVQCNLISVDEIIRENLMCFNEQIRSLVGS